MGSSDRDVTLGSRRTRPVEGEIGAGRAALLAAALIFAHLALLSYFAPRALLSSGRLVLNDAFAIEAYRAFRARDALASLGTTAAYDPTVLGGQLAGMVEVFGTRLFLFVVGAAGRFGADPVRAFDGAVVAVHAVVPLVGYGAARAFRLGRGAALITTALWSSLWFFDSVVHYAWFSGRIGWASSCAVAVAFLGVGSRVAAGGDPRWAFAVLTIGLGALLLHPVPALAAAVVLAGVALGRSGILPWRRALLLGSALVPLLGLVPVGRRAAALSSEPITRVFDVGVSQVFWDVLDLSSNGYRAPGATRAMVRLMVFVAGAVGLARYRASADYRYAPLAAASGIGFGVAYFGGYVPIAWPVDPYFLLIFGAFAAAVPASALLADVDWSAVLQSRVVRAWSAVALFVGVPRLVRTVATFMPEMLPDRVVRSTIDVLVSPLVGIKEPLPDRFRLEAAPPSFAIAAEWLAEHYGGQTILVDDAALAAHLSMTGTLPIIGPLGERGAPSAMADPTPLFAEPAAPERIGAFIDRYGIGWVALWGAPSRLDFDHPLLDPIVRVAGVRIRKVRREATFFVEGAGRVQSMSLGHVRVSMDRASMPAARVTLRFHYDSSLECRPSCRVTREASPPAGFPPFVTIENPPGEFELVTR